MNTYFSATIIELTVYHKIWFLSLIYLSFQNKNNKTFDIILNRIKEEVFKPHFLTYNYFVSNKKLLQIIKSISINQSFSLESNFTESFFRLKIN
jgi:hypothetical protein